MRKTKILICSSELGAGKRGASLGPDAIRVTAVDMFYNLFDQLDEDEIKVKQLNRFSPMNKRAKYIKAIADTHQKICTKMAETIRRGNLALIFSGDHSNAAGFFSGLREAYPDKKLGLIWIDAHGDLHSPYTSPSGNMHGMPLAVLLGIDNHNGEKRKLKPEVVESWEAMKRTGASKITPKLNPEDMVLIGIRDLEKEEWGLVEKLNIKHYTPERQAELGLDTIIQETVEHFKDYDGVYVSFDVDSLDPSISKGTGTPVPNGFSIEDAKKMLKEFTAMRNFKALEVTEVNPLLDCENKMAVAVVRILRESLRNMA